MNFKHIFTIGIAATALIACERPEIEGPTMEELYGPFSVEEPFQASTTTADFSTETVTFSASFARRVDWEIHILGLSSGGEKVISGRSAVIDETNSAWKGTTTTFPLLEEEDVQITLLLPNLEAEYNYQTDTLSLTIEQTVDYTRFNALLIEDFNDGHSPQTVLSGTDTLWAYPPIVNAGSFEGARHTRTSFPGITWDYFINGLELMPENGPYFDLPKRSDEVLYLNFALKGNVQAPLTNLIVTIGEDDDNDSLSGRGWNPDAGVNFEHFDDRRTFEISMNGITEWTWISIPLGSDEGFPVDCGADGCNGNGLINMNKIVSVGVVAVQNDLESKLNHWEMDMVYFSWGGPLEGY